MIVRVDRIQAGYTGCSDDRRAPTSGLSSRGWLAIASQLSASPRNPTVHSIPGRSLPFGFNQSLNRNTSVSATLLQTCILYRRIDMPDRRTRQGVMSALSLALLMVVGTAAAEDLRLVDAMKNQDRQRVRTLLDQHADVNVRSEDGSTALLWAAHWNDLQTAELLVRAGADANAANDFRMTPLSQACTNGSAGFVNLLLKAGANPDTPVGTGETPLMTCARAGAADAVRALLVRGADVNAKEPTQHQTALMWAAAEQHPTGASDAHRGAGGSQGAHKTGIYRAALCCASRRPGIGSHASGRRRRREHPIAARS